MGKLIYPNTWQELSQAPSVRSELMGFVRDVVEWNNETSYVKLNGADNILAFFYDWYCMDEGVSHVVGQLIFQDELREFEEFIANFDSALVEWKSRGNPMTQFHDARMPSDTLRSAERLLRKLEERGVPAWQE